MGFYLVVMESKCEAVFLVVIGNTDYYSCIVTFVEEC